MRRSNRLFENSRIANAAKDNRRLRHIAVMPPSTNSSAPVT
jgi:hypothetical protein